MKRPLRYTRYSDDAVMRSTQPCGCGHSKTARNPTNRFFSVSRPVGQTGRAESNDVTIVSAGAGDGTANVWNTAKTQRIIA